jgi:hypothetical protein
MNTNRTWILLTAGLVAGIALALLLPRAFRHTPAAPEPTPPVPSEASAPALASRAPKTPAPRPTPPAPAPSSVTPQAKVAPTSAWARLAEKYGPEKTALSGKITANLANVIDDGIDLANTAARNAGAASVAEAASRDAMRNLTNRLGLTAEQQQQASVLIQSAVSKRLGAVTELATAMRAEPEQLMETFLAGDALARKEISQDEYDQTTLATRTMLQNIGGFVAGRPGAGGLAQILGDEKTAADLNALLTPEQQATLAEMTAKMAEQAQARQGRRSNSDLTLQNGRIPVMELERLDQSVASIEQMAQAARLMMDAMKGLKDANPTPVTR